MRFELLRGPALARVVASYAPPGSNREDLAQEVAMALVRALPAFRGQASLKTYVLRIAHNICLRQVMRKRRRKVDRRGAPRNAMSSR